MALLALFTANFDGTSKPENFAKSVKMALLALLALGKIEVEVPASQGLGGNFGRSIRWYA